MKLLVCVFIFCTSALFLAQARAQGPSDAQTQPEAQAPTEAESSPADDTTMIPMKHQLGAGPSDCGDGMMTWDLSTAMCMPYAMDGMTMSHLMLHGNGFAVFDTQGGPRGNTAFAGPDMFMIDAGKSNGGVHFFNAELMGTLEKWTYPPNGYPELLQIGETNSNGAPFVDAQHPHSSPIMGLTFSDRITLGSGRENLKLFFAPRGESTDGPIPFMHRATGMVNPDAPLGHHIGQDVGHVTSTVAGASLSWDGTYIEGSAFNGTEPEPENVDLPMGPLNSGAVRVGRQLSTSDLVMGSAAYIQSPEPADPSIASEWRYSLSFYDERNLGSHKLQNTLIAGAVTNYDYASSLFSFLEEFLLSMDGGNFWGRLEILQRTPGELLITSLSDQNNPRWVSALTLGYTFKIVRGNMGDIGLGGSVTENILPQDYQSTYGGNPGPPKFSWNFQEWG